MTGIFRSEVTETYRDNLFRELIIDNFAGGGGASVGIELALGAPVDIAVNHDESAIAMHTVNHPYTEHFRANCADMAVCKRPIKTMAQLNKILAAA